MIKNSKKDDDELERERKHKEREEDQQLIQELIRKKLESHLCVVKIF